MPAQEPNHQAEAQAHPARAPQGVAKRPGATHLGIRTTDLSASRGGPELKLLRADALPCAFCGGSGKHPGSVGRCAVCAGKGEVKVDPPALRCPYCRGSGTMGGRGSHLTCTVCLGKGVVSVRRLQEPVAACPQCRGTARHPQSKLPCTTCRGLGLISRPQAAATAGEVR